jgi:ribosomal-protein-alanine N-acetyltransferase
MIFFETKRLSIRSLKSADFPFFKELFTDAEVLRLIPQKALSEEELHTRFTRSLNLELQHIHERKCDCAIFKKGTAELIGLVLFLINEEGEREMGYRFRKAYWKKGYGMETAKGLLHFYFTEVNAIRVIADAYIENKGSLRILEQLMTFEKKFFNEKEECTERRYALTKAHWLKQIQQTPL